MKQTVSYVDNLVRNHHERLIQAVLGIYAVAGIVFIGVTLQKEVGFEPVWIARAVAEGEGFSFPFKLAWLCTAMCEQGREAGDFIASAWADPIFTYFYATLISLFGEETARLIIRPLHLALFIGACVFTAKTARILGGPWAAIIALGFLLVATKHHATTINSAPVATLWISLIAFNLVRYFDDPSRTRIFALGVLMALSAMSWSSTILFIPVVVFIVLIQGNFKLPAFQASAIAVLVAVAVVSPWSLRNYIVFDEFVPVRNGVGQVAWIGTVGAAGTFKENVAASEIPAPYASKGPGDAIRGIIGTTGAENLFALEQWQEAIMDEQIPEKSSNFNEATQDKWLFKQARNFVFERPFAAAQLAFFKLHAFADRVDFPVPYTGWLATLMTVLTYVAIIGGFYLITVRIEVSALVLMLAAFVAPFVAIAPYYYRYRQPIDPIFAILLGVTIVVLVNLARERYAERPATSS